ncbi:hypothetical protein [Flavisolibacter ginsengisoli]|uniref:Uncharacterized protein n=1 Tax=Flavisolibacter ginsengisoli DSM 18119 TaxID=1121884 RepID=A0A1M4XY52_9BACT|nr:hypothetical protein [Flavisolibacter ginsengisoli]SHE98421.1 hypothetical protein SAMN02745131_01527 [Flavisolibacter ginsengisoli DSM 18119]
MKNFVSDYLYSATAHRLNWSFVKDHTSASTIHVCEVFPIMKRLLTLFSLIGLTTCNQSNPKVDTKTMDFGAFSVRTPQSWQQIKARGTDSYVGRIAIDEKDTLDFLSR